ncbi:zinc finger protein 37-like isoform X2 [Ruditapes philippinarum]|uniref:zinc finger protein 37-like isoform X2 n=1 Tax=Ruditapes philippinarum TaxID=129788 RepID=UPI00295C3281|nr:zinc finger protein 37-like isoform X2 [Ruditapes philippinarum]
MVSVQSSEDDGKYPGQGKSLFMPKVQRKFVNLGSMTGRWMKIKSKKYCKSDEDLARLLIKRYWKRRNIPKLESYRIITLQTDVWTRWRKMKCSLQVNSNSQFANVLMNAWHDRAEYIQNLCDAFKAIHQAPINETQVMDAVKNEADVAEAPVNEISMHKNHVESAPVDEAFVNETSLSMNNKAPMTEALRSTCKYLVENAPVNDASVSNTSSNNIRVEGASGNETPVTETDRNKNVVKDASVDKASVTEDCRKTCNYIIEDAPVNGASVNNTFRNKYLVKDVSVNKALVTEAFKNKVLVEHAYARENPAPVNEAAVTEAFRNKLVVEDASMNEIPDTLNEALVKQEIMPDQSDKINSEPCREVSTACQSVKEECVSEEEECVSEEEEYVSEEEECVSEGEESVSEESDIEDIMNYLEGEKKMIKITEGPTEDNAELGNRRRSSRVQSRGYRPDYASLEWIDDHAKNSKDNVSTNVITIEDKQTYVGRKTISTKDIGVTEGEDFKNDCKTKRIDKRKAEDPDFFPDKIDKVENINECDDRSETDEDESYILGIEGDCLTDSKISNKDMEKRKRKIGNSIAKNCKKRRKQGDNAKYEIQKKEKTKKDNKSDQRLEKKPWVHIQLEEHQDKYSKETVKSFARKDRNVDITEELFKCLLCGNFKSTAKDYFEAHIEKHVNKVLECDKCSYVGYSELVLLRHKFSVGHVSGKNQYMCDICGIILYTSEARLSHIGKKHGNPQFQCRFCDEKFATNDTRKKHYRTVHTDLVKYCFNCKMGYSDLTLEDFKDHQSSCKVSHKCQVCGVFLVSKSGLKRHIKLTHMNERKYQCSECPYSAKTGRRLKEHELSHRSKFVLP